MNAENRSPQYEVIGKNVTPYIKTSHDDVIKWKHFPRNWPFVREIHRSPVNFPHKGQWRGALMFSLNYAWINDWVNNREAGDLRRQHGHYDVIVMKHYCSWVGVSFYNRNFLFHHRALPRNAVLDTSEYTSCTNSDQSIGTFSRLMFWD